MANPIEKNIDNINALGNKLYELSDALDYIKENSFDLSDIHLEKIDQYITAINNAIKVTEDFAIKGVSIGEVNEEFKQLNNEVVKSGSIVNNVINQINNLINEVDGGELVEQLNIVSVLEKEVDKINKKANQPKSEEGLSKEFREQQLGLYQINQALDLWIGNLEHLDSVATASFSELREELSSAMEGFKLTGNIDNYKNTMKQLSAVLVEVKKSLRELDSELADQLEGPNRKLTEEERQARATEKVEKERVKAAKEAAKEQARIEKEKRHTELEARYEGFKQSGGFKGILSGSEFSLPTTQLNTLKEEFKELTKASGDIYSKYGKIGAIGPEAFLKVNDAIVKAIETMQSLDSEGSNSEEVFNKLRENLNETRRAFSELKLEEIGLDFKDSKIEADAKNAVRKAAEAAEQEAKKTSLAPSIIQSSYDNNITASVKNLSKGGVSLDQLEQQALGGEIQVPIKLGNLDQKSVEKVTYEASTAAIEIGKEFEKQEIKPKINITDTINSVKKAFSSLGQIFNGVYKIFDSIVNAINKMVSIAKSGFKAIKNAIDSVVSSAKSLIELFGNFGNRIRSLADSIHPLSSISTIFENIKNSITGLVQRLDKLTSSFLSIFSSKIIDSANDLYISVQSLVNIVGKESARDVVKFAENLETAFGISPTNLLRNVNRLTGVLFGVGIAADDVGRSTKNLSFLAEYFVGQGLVKDSETAINAFTSAMRGAGKSISQLGILMNDSSLDNYLKKLKQSGGIYSNIATDFSKLTDEQKAYVRYSYIISQSNKLYNFDTFGEQLDNAAGRMYKMKNAALSLSDTLRTGLYQILSQLAPAIAIVINLLNALIREIFSLFNIKFDLGDIVDQSSGLESVSGAADDAAKSFNDMEDAANKAKGTVLGFDKVTSLYSNDSGTENIGAGFDYSGLINQDVFDFEGINKEADDIFDILKKKTEDFETWASKKTGRIDFNLGFNWDLIKVNLKDIHDNIKNTIDLWGSFFINIGLKILDDINIGSIVTEFTSFIVAATDLARIIADVLTPALDSFYESGIKPIVEWIGNKLVDGLQFGEAELSKWSNWFIDNKDTINSFFESLGVIVGTVWGVFEPYFNAGWDTLKTKIEGIGTALRTAFDSLMGNTIKEEDTIVGNIETWPEKIEATVEKIKRAFDVLKGDEKLSSEDLINAEEGDKYSQLLVVLQTINEVVTPMVDIVAELGKAFGEFTVNEALPWILEQLQQLGPWLDEHKEDIISLLQQVGSFTFDKFQDFVELVKKLIDYIVENPDVLTKFFSVVIGLKVAQGIVSFAQGLGMASIGMQGFVAALAPLAGVAPIILGVTAGIAAFIAIGVRLFQISENFRDTVASAFDSVSDAWGRLKERFTGDGEGLFDKLGQAIDRVVKALEPFMIIITGLAGGLLAGIIDGLAGIADFLLNTFISALDLVTGVLDLIWGMMTGDKEKIDQGLSEIGNAFITFILGLPKLLFDSIAVFGTFIIESIENIGTGLVDGFQKGISDAWGTFISWIDSLWQGLIDSVRNFFGIHSPSTVFSDFGDNIIQGLFSGISETWEKLKSNIEAIWQGVVDGIEGIFGDLPDWFSDTFKNAKDLALGAFDGIKDKFKNIKDDIVDVFKGIGEKIGGFFSPVKDALSWAGGKIQGGIEFITGGKIPRVENPISKHALGGSIQPGQLFIANENGAELVGNLGSTKGADVANNNMIIKGIKEASKEGMVEAMEPLLRLMRSDTGRKIDIHIDGAKLVTADGMRELAMTLAQLINAGSINIADIGFSI